MNSSTDAGLSELKALARRAMLARGLWPDFSAQVQRETDALARAVRGAAGAATGGARDLRALPWVSIDNDDSRDLDQITVAEGGPHGIVRVLVAIADVAAVVARDTPIDQHALHNTTSVYTAAQVFPMLPERLSTDLTSLVQGEERAAIVVEMSMAADGTVQQSDVYPAVVMNKAKLAYDGLAAWLEGRASAPAPLAAAAGLEEQLRSQDRIAQTLKHRREASGALALQTLETRVVFDGEAPRDLRAERSNRATELIEEFMIAANVATAQYLRERGFASVRRVLAPPERWQRIVAMASSLGAELPPAPSALALNAFLLERRKADAAGFPDLSLSVIKLLGRAEYALALPGRASEGHFGLALSDYMHSTAPNRRFPDLLTQRLLRAAMVRAASPYTIEQLRELAAHCTEQEDRASKIERQIAKSAAAMLLAARIGERFDAIVTGASAKGTWVRLAASPIEGRVVEGFQGLDVGDRTRVRLVHTDVERGFIDFARVE